jgi:hypothetical protein
MSPIRVTVTGNRGLSVNCIDPPGPQCQIVYPYEYYRVIADKNAEAGWMRIESFETFGTLTCP